MPTWNDLNKKNFHSLWQVKLDTIYQNDGKLAYELSLRDIEAHEEYITDPKNQTLIIHEDGFVSQNAKTQVIDLKLRSKTLTRVKIQFLDALEFLVDEIVVGPIPATSFARLQLGEEDFEYPVLYELSAAIKRADISAKATAYDIFLPEALD